MEHLYKQVHGIINELSYALGNYLIVETVLAVSFLLLIICACTFKNKKIYIPFTLIIFVASIILNQAHLNQVVYNEGIIIIDTLYHDQIAINFKFLALVSGLLSSLCVLFDKDLEKNNTPEILSLVVLATLGACLLVSAYNFLIALIALEVISITIYLICSFFRDNKTALLGTYKYLIANIFFSLIFVYGISMLYGLTTSITISGTLSYLFNMHGLSKYFIIAIILAVIFFKLFIFPFNFLAPDIYEAASIGGINFLSTVSKIAFFGILYRISYILNNYKNLEIINIFIVCSFFSLIFGAYCALKQKNIKRLLGYGSVADSGFLFAIIALSLSKFSYININYVVYYLLVYMISIAGLCIVLTGLSKKYHSYNIIDYISISKNKRYLFIYFVIFVVSLVGLPPTSGFLSKFLILTNTISNIDFNLFIVFITLFILSTIITIFYYVRILTYMIKKGSYYVSLKNEASDLYRLVLSFTLVIIIIVLLIYPFPDFKS